MATVSRGSADLVQAVKRVKSWLSFYAVAYAVSLGWELAVYLSDGALGGEGSFMATVTTTVPAIAVLGTGIATLRWFYPSYKQAYDLPGQTLSKPPVWAWLGWVVPIVSLWYPYQMVTELWDEKYERLSESQREGLYSLEQMRPLFGRWWALYLAMNILPAMVVVLVSEPSAATLAAVAVLSLALMLASVYTYSNLLGHFEDLEQAVAEGTEALDQARVRVEDLYPKRKEP